MHVVAKKTLEDYWKIHPNSQIALQSWYSKANKAKWDKPSDVTNEIATARHLGNGRFIFNINKNDYRLVVQFIFKYQKVYIRFVGTHAEYDKIDPIKI